MTLQEAELVENARTPFELNVESADDDVLVVTDSAQDEHLWRVVLVAARSTGVRPTVHVLPRPTGTERSLPGPVREAMFASDLTVLVPSESIVHGPDPIEAQRRAVKLLTLEGTTADILAGPASSADYSFIYEEGKRIREKWSKGKRVTVTSPLGMDLEASIEGRNGYFAVGKVEEQPEGIDLYSASFPDGEAAIAPIEGTANGTIVWDTTVDGIGRLASPIEATVEDGYITGISRGTEADQMSRMLERIGHPDAYAIGEIAIGLNPRARITGNAREDKKARGYLHVGLGGSVDHGGTIVAPGHVDGVIANATLAIDGEAVVEDGEVVD